jgi:hypothetical protein
VVAILPEINLEIDLIVVERHLEIEPTDAEQQLEVVICGGWNARRRSERLATAEAMPYRNN